MDICWERADLLVFRFCCFTFYCLDCLCSFPWERMWNLIVSVPVHCLFVYFPYMGITLSDDLQWSAHIRNITKKANSTLGFLRRNLKNCPEECRRLAYIPLVIDLHLNMVLPSGPLPYKGYKLYGEMQRQAASFIKKDYKSRGEGYVTKMLIDRAAKSSTPQRI